MGAQESALFSEVPNAAALFAILTVLVKVTRALMSIAFDESKQELRNKICKLFDIQQHQVEDKKD